MIQKTIEDASKYGMAASFKARKDELKMPLFLWGLATIFSLCILICGAVYMLQIATAQSFQWTDWIMRLPLMAALIWLGWFCTKQYGYTVRIREDYSFKYAVSLAFEGYKSQAKDVNEELLKDLLKLTIVNMGKNPLEIYRTKYNHGSPLHEFFSKGVKAKIKAGVSGVDMEGDIPGADEDEN